MDVNYARLCLGYLAATMLLHGRVTLDDFTRSALDDSARHALAARVFPLPNTTQDPNALAPQTVRVLLHNGQAHGIELPAVLGHPQRPLPAQAQRAKFNACCAHAGLASATTEQLHAACQGLADADDATRLIDTMCNPRAPWPN